MIWESGGLLKKQSSSSRYKENIRPWSPASTRGLFALPPIQYDYINGAKNVVGLSAEDVYAVMPEAVNLDEHGRPDSIRQETLNVYLLSVIKEMRHEIDALKAALKQ